MMVSPQSYLLENRDKTYSELIEERGRLVQSIEAFESSDYNSRDRGICPSQDVIYQCNLEYLAVLCRLIENKYRLEKMK